MTSVEKESGNTLSESNKAPDPFQTRILTWSNVSMVVVRST